jgi:prepilin-type processing-associated H-X9-DG protein
MLSERLRGSGDAQRFEAQRDFTFLPTPPTTADATIVRCRRLHELRLAGLGGSFPWGGMNWVSTGLEHTLYNHTMPPNSAIADCVDPVGGGMLGPSSARSAHPGGVNVVFGDGSCRFVADVIDLQVWRALATRNGGEAVLAGSY